MNTQTVQSIDLAARGHLIGIAPFIVGIIVAGGLIAAVVLGRRIRRREPPTPRPEEQPKLPEGGPVFEVRENREPDEMPRSDHRLTPHELHDSGTQQAESDERRIWDEGSGGSFGSGGSGTK